MLDGRLPGTQDGRHGDRRAPAAACTLSHHQPKNTLEHDIPDNNPYAPPLAKIEMDSATESLERQTMAARLSGLGLASALVGGGISGSLVLVMVPAQTLAPMEGGRALVGLIPFALGAFIIAVGGLSLWRLHPSAKVLVWLMAPCSLLGFPLVPLMATAVVWWTRTPAGKMVLSTEGVDLRKSNPAESRPAGQTLRWFLTGVAVIGLQPVVLLLFGVMA